jgi:SM-20-related protein
MSDAYMNTVEQKIKMLIAQLESQGYAVLDDFVDHSSIRAHQNLALLLLAEGKMKSAKTGLNHQQTSSQFRGDFTYWIDDLADYPPIQEYQHVMNQMRLAINQHFFLGLFDLESHYAIYPTGTSYQKHLDQFIGNEERQLSTILYLNESWTASAGGQLRLYLDDKNPQKYLDIEPTGGRLVVFFSGEFPHEVLPAKRQRISLTGWFKKRNKAI